MAMVQRTHDPFESFWRAPSGLYIPAGARRRSRPVAVDLFAGCGGFSLGFHQAGWHVAAAVEYDTAATATYLVNLGSPDTVLWSGPGIDGALETGQLADNPEDGWSPCSVRDVLNVAGTGWISHAGEVLTKEPTDPNYVPVPADEPAVEHFFQGDIRHLTGTMILDALGVDQGEVDAVIGGPPCQGFSAAGKRDVMDPRNSLVFDFARIVCEIQPRAFIMENVPGIVNMLTPEGVPVLDALALIYETGGMGTFDALRRSLYGSAGAITAIKGRPVGRARREAESAKAPARSLPAADDAQLDLFGDAS